MRRFLAVTLTLLLAGALFGARNWNTYTNTTHVYDVVELDGELWLATWGGLVEFDPATGAFLQTYTNIDGLASPDVRAVAALPTTGELFIGSTSAGVDRMIHGEFVTPVNNINGLADDRVLDVTVHDSLLFVSTVLGVSGFTSSNDFPFPLLIDTFGQGDGPTSDAMTDIGVTDSGYLVCMYAEGVNYVHIDSLLAASAWHVLQSDEPHNDFDSGLRQMSVNGDNIALATNYGVIRITGFPYDMQVEEYKNDVLESGDVYPAYIDDDGALWFSYGEWNAESLLLESPDTLAWVTRIDEDGNMTTWDYNDGLATSAMKGFFEYGGDLWANTWGEGCYRLHDGVWTNYKPQSISSNVVTAMVVDKDSRLWTASGYLGVPPTATGTRGVSMYDEDADTWESWRAATSGLHTDNVNCMAVDALNRVWMGSYAPNDALGWHSGVGVYDPATDNWDWLYVGGSGLVTGTITSIIPDTRSVAIDNPQMWVSCYGTGSGAVVSLDMNYHATNQFQVPWDGESFQNTIEMYMDDDVCWFGGYYDGVILWEDSASQPTDNSSLWEYPPFTALHGSGYMHSFTRQEDDWSLEWWIAGTPGLFTYDGEDWFKLDINYKRYRWNRSQHDWEVSQRYFVNEERLYGGEVSSPSCLLTDPFGRVWIGTDGAGLTMYDPYIDRYTTYNVNNAPLLSNNITSLAYSPRTGRLYIGTIVGLNSVEIGRAQKWRTDVSKLRAAPNPFYPSEGQVFTIANGEEGSFPVGDWTCRIYDIAGELVVELDEDIFFQFSWDGTNEMGKECSSGVYFYVVYDGEGEAERGTVSLIR